MISQIKSNDDGLPIKLGCKPAPPVLLLDTEKPYCYWRANKSKQLAQQIVTICCNLFCKSFGSDFNENKYSFIFDKCKIDFESNLTNPDLIYNEWNQYNGSITISKYCLEFVDQNAAFIATYQFSPDDKFYSGPTSLNVWCKWEEDGAYESAIALLTAFDVRHKLARTA